MSQITIIKAALLLLVAPTVGDQPRPSPTADDYPRIARLWSDVTGKHRVEAQLVSASETAVVLRKDDSEQVTVPVDQFDAASREVAADARPYFLLEETLQELLDLRKQQRAARRDAAQARAEMSAAVARANERLRGVKIRLRHRIIRFSGKMPPRRTTSPTGEHMATLRPLFRFHDGASADSAPIPGFSLTIWNVKAEDVDAARVVAGQSVMEFVGTPVLRTGKDQHFRPSHLVSGTDAIGIALEGETVRVFTPDPNGTGLDSLFYTPPPTDKPPPKRPDLASRHEETERKTAEAFEDARKGPPTGFAVKTDHGYAVTGSRIKRSITCNGDNVAIVGSFNELTIRGKCERLSFGGAGNIVTVEDVAVIAFAGTKNVVNFVRGPGGKEPKIFDPAGQNKTTRIQSIPKTAP